MKHFCLTLLAIAFITANLLAVIFKIEEWPLTPAPMFARYIDEDTPRYRFAFTALQNNGSEQELGYYSVNAHWSLMRFFFRYVYGSVNPESLSYRFQSDTPQQFKSRTETFFKVFFIELNKYNPQIAQNVTSIRLDLFELEWQVNADLARTTVGTFDVGTSTFNLVTPDTK